MKFNKILSIALMFPALVAFHSCAEDSFEYMPAEPATGTQVYFPGSVKSDYVVSAVDTVFTLNLERVDKDSVAHIALSAETDSVTAPLFVFPSVAVFEAGEKSTTITCIAKADQMEYDKTYTVKLSIANPEDATLYGLSSVTLNITCPAPWKSLGVGKFADAYLGGAGNYSEVEIQQNELDPKTFRIVEPYAEILEGIATDKYFEFSVLPKGYDFQGTILDAEYVVFKDYNTGAWNSNYAEDIYALHPYRFGRTPDKWSYNVVLEYQENGLPGEVSMAPLYYLFNEGGGWDKTTANTISVLFPGFVKADYSAAMTYAGIFTTPDGTTHAVADLTLGADATDVKAIVMPADAAAAAVADAIAAGELEAMDVQAGRIEVPFNAEELGGSNFNIIAVVMADGKVKTVVSASYEYYGGGDSNPWTSLGTGFFTDDIVAPLFGVEPVTYEVEILEHSENPGLYRVMNPYSNSVYPYAEDDCAEEGLYLEVNATDAEGVYIQYQTLGFDWGYGEFGFETVGASLLSTYEFDTIKGAGYFGKVIEGVVKFPTFTAKNEQQTKYQGYTYMGESGYYAGMNSKIEIVLPGANAFARNMAKAMANTAKRNLSKSSLSAAKAEMKMKKIYNLQAEMCETPNF